jgi:hypothetical protein
MAKSKSTSSMKKPSGHIPAGGAFSSKKKEVPIRTGPPSTEKINPKAVAQLGGKVGEKRAVEKIHAGTMSQVPPGNLVAAKTVCGPGGSRDVHRSGMQGVHGPSAGSRPEPTSEIFPGFGGKKGS